VTAQTVRFHPGPGATPRTRAFFEALSLSNGGNAAAPETSQRKRQ
jgi:hypothetical protein